MMESDRYEEFLSVLDEYVSKYIQTLEKLEELKLKHLPNNLYLEMGGRQIECGTAIAVLTVIRDKFIDLYSDKFEEILNTDVDNTDVDMLELIHNQNQEIIKLLKSKNNDT